LWGARERARFIPGDTVQDAPERGYTDAGQLLLLFRGQGERSTASQVLGSGEKCGLEPLRTGIVQRLGRQSNDFPQVGAIGGASLPASGMSLQVRAQEADEALSVQAGVGFHFVQQTAPFLAVRFLIPFLHPAQILIPLFYGHRFLRVHLHLR
jgi:hypothetical protein